MNSSLFTIVVDYDGGTYISQNTAYSALDSAQLWASPDEYLIEKLGISIDQISHLRNDLAEFPPVLLDGLTNAWCSTSRIKGKILLMNIILTHKMQAEQSDAPNTHPWHASC